MPDAQKLENKISQAQNLCVIFNILYIDDNCHTN